MTHSDIDDLIRVFAKLPGLGPRSARRVVLHLMRQKEKLMLPMAETLSRAATSISHCTICGNLDSHDPCHICTDSRRDATMVCVVEDVADLWAIERCNLYKGHYHVLGGTLSAMEDRGPNQLHMQPLIERVFAGNISELILAMNATLEGQTTAHYIMGKIEGSQVNVSRLAQGIPMGGELDYLDDGTLGAALKARLPA